LATILMDVVPRVSPALFGRDARRAVGGNTAACDPGGVAAHCSTVLPRNKVQLCAIIPPRCRRAAFRSLGLRTPTVN
jgi:hypothetical protein